MNTRTPVAIMIPAKDSIGLFEAQAQRVLPGRVHVGKLFFCGRYEIIEDPAYMVRDDGESQAFRDSLDAILRFTILIDSSGIAHEEYYEDGMMKQRRWSGNPDDLEHGEYGLSFGDNNVRLVEVINE